MCNDLATAAEEPVGGEAAVGGVALVLPEAVAGEMVAEEYAGPMSQCLRLAGARAIHLEPRLLL